MSGVCIGSAVTNRTTRYRFESGTIQVDVQVVRAGSIPAPLAIEDETAARVAGEWRATGGARWTLND